MNTTMEPTSPERWQRIEALLDAALDRPASERAAFLESACGGDDALRAEVERLLAAAEGPATFLDAGAAEFAAGLVARLPDPPPPATPSIPARIGPFRIVRELGRGGMGTVYLAEREEHFRQSVALKVVRRGLHFDEALVRRFVEERQILASLDHPNIARLVDGGVTADGVPWFAMELVEGEAIDRWCDARRLPIEARLELFCTVCDALEYAHRRHVVHRDLKPSNILVRADGTVKVVDFGIAKLLAPDVATRVDQTLTGLRLLTPEYASPEQIRGDAVSAASDVYSLGIVLFELLTGQRPHRVTGPQEAEQAVLTRDPPRPSTVVRRTHGATTGEDGGATSTRIAHARATTPERLSERLRGELDRITLKALAKQPEQRYASAALLAEDIRRHLEGLPVRARPARAAGTRIAAALAGVALLAAGGLWLLSRGAGDPAADDAARAGATIAVGLIADYRDGGAPAAARPLADLLATNLARLPALQVVSTARLYELMAQLGAGPEPDAGAYSAAARRAGAAVLIDGSLYGSADGGLRLDLRRIDVATGSVLSAYTVSGRDLFALVDSGTARIAAEAGARAPAGSIADVTTRSEVAYRFYEEGLRTYYQGDHGAARRLFEAAFAEDSAFAMAAYYLARLADRSTEVIRRFEQAVRLAERASDRERLIIHAAAAFRMGDLRAVAIAETLVVRYPHEPEAHRFAGQARLEAGELAGAAQHLRQAIAMDSLARAGGQAACPTCEARSLLVDVYLMMDSLPAAEREARRWVEQDTASAAAWLMLSNVEVLLGRVEAARTHFSEAARIDPTLRGSPYYYAYHHMVPGDYEAADAALRDIAATGTPERREEAHWYLTISLRRQGRLVEALEAARAQRALSDSLSPSDSSRYSALLVAQVLLEMGRYRESAALFDSIARSPAVGAAPSMTVRHSVWALTHAANALAAAGDTAAVAARIDTIRALGARSLPGRDRRLHHHVRGLLLAARGDDEAAVAEFRQAMFTPVMYTRTTWELARALLRLGRPREAVAVLQPAVRVAIEGSMLYVTRTDLEETLARAWDAAGAADSALVHYRNVERALRNADPPLQPRVAAVRERIAALAGVR